jgi:hypothetical protein
MIEENQDKWLRDGNLIYKLKDGVNCDEIVVNMSGGSRDSKSKEEKAEKLLKLIDILPLFLRSMYKAKFAHQEDSWKHGTQDQFNCWEDEMIEINQIIKILEDMA